MITQFTRLVGVLMFLTAVAVQAAPVRWTKVSTAHFTILTADSTATAKEWAACLEAFRESLNELAPTDGNLLEPMTMVVFDRPDSYLAVAAPHEKRQLHHISVFRFINRDGRFIGAVNPEDGEMARHGAFLQSGLWLTNSYRQPLPLWLGTGLQHVYAYYDVSGKRMTIGGAVDGSAQSLRDGLRLPLDQMFGMSTRSPTYQKDAGYFNAQSWAFVHYLLMADKGVHRPKLARFMDAIQRGETEAAARALAFPEGMDVLAAQFGRYIKRGAYRIATLPVDLNEMAQRVTARPATEAEVQLALGRLLLYFQGAGVAEPYLLRAQALAPDDSEVFEGLAALANARNDNTGMMECYQAAVRHGSRNYLAHYYAALPGVQRFFGGEAAADGIAPTEARRAVDAIKATLELRPGFYPAYDMLAGLLGSLEFVTDDDLRLITEGRRRFPDDAVLAAGLAVYEIQARRYAQAKARLEQILAGEMENSGRIRGYAFKLLQRLAAVNSLALLEQHCAQQDMAAALALVPQLERAPLLPAERARFAVLRGPLMSAQTLQRVQELMAARRWDMAVLLLEDMARGDLPEPVRANVQKLRQQAQDELTPPRP